MGRISTSKQRLMDAARHLIWHLSYGSTTIEAICEKAEVKKGSFYYFFNSKSDLAAAALRADWEARKPLFDSMFSGPPLERMKKFFTFVYEGQNAIKARHGLVLGCPLFCLGCEVSTLDRGLCEVVRGILDQYQKYLEDAIQEAQREGLIDSPNASAKAKCVFSYFEGALTRARIENDVEPLKSLYATTLEIIGAPAALAA